MYTVTATKDGETIQAQSLSDIIKALGVSDWAFKKVYKKAAGIPFELAGWKITTTLRQPEGRKPRIRIGNRPAPATPDGVYAIRGIETLLRRTFHELSLALGEPQKGLYTRWYQRGRPRSFQYKGMTIGIGKPGSVEVVNAKPKRTAEDRMRAVWRETIAYVEDPIPPRLGGLLAAGYQVSRLGAAKL